MAASNSTPNQTLMATIIGIFFLMILSKVHSLSDLTFKFDKFVPKQPNLLLQGDASVSSTTGVLQLTNVTKPSESSVHSIGRALYGTPLQIWDKTTGKVASFATFFSFLVKASKEDRTSDGLTFFLGPANSQIPSGTQSGYFGLFNSSNYDASSQIVAVEFDTFFGSYDPWDPSYKHIGIDVNSIKSQKTAKWDWKDGEVANVVITYQASTNSLSVSQYYPSDGTSNVLTASVKLKEILPEWISVGFSAGYGADDFEIHNILSWYFTTNDVLTAAAIKNNKENNVSTTAHYVALYGVL